MSNLIGHLSKVWSNLASAWEVLQNLEILGSIFDRYTAVSREEIQGKVVQA